MLNKWIPPNIAPKMVKLTCQLQNERLTVNLTYLVAWTIRHSWLTYEHPGSSRIVYQMVGLNQPGVVRNQKPKADSFRTKTGSVEWLEGRHCHMHMEIPLTTKGIKQEINDWLRV